MSNPLVAAPVSTSTPFQGAFLLEDGEALKAAIENGDWLGGGMAAFSAAANTVATVMDPLGSLIAAGLGWVMEHVEPLKGWLNDLTGDAGEVQAFAQTWSNISTHLMSSGDELVRILGDVDSAEGEAADAYRRFQADAAAHIRAAGDWASAMSTGMQVAATIVQIVHDLVRDAIAQVVGSVISYAATLVVSLGTATPYVIAQATSRTAALAARVGTTVTKLVRAIGKLGELLDSLMALFRRFSSTFDGVLPGGRTPDAPRTPDGPDGPSTPRGDDGPGSGSDPGGSGPPATPHLDAADIQAIRDYTGPGYVDINQALRGQIPMTPAIQARIDALSGALNRLPDQPATMYRGEFRTSPAEISYFQNLKPGDPVTFDAYTSTSIDPTQAFPGNVQYVITGSGKNVEPWSSVPSELELLLDRGSTFEVVKVTPNGSGDFLVELRQP